MQYVIKYAALAVALVLMYITLDVLILRACGRTTMETTGTEAAGITVGCISWAVYFAL